MAGNIPVARQKLYSPIFIAGDNDDLKWRLDLYPTGFSDPNTISLYLHLRRTYQYEITAQYRFSILNQKGQVAYQLPWSPKSTFNEYGVWGFDNFIKRADLLKDAAKLLPNDNLIIYCEVKASLGYEITLTETTTAQLSTHAPELEACNDFQWLLDTGSYSDVTLLINGREFLAHKGILASRSSVFRQKFQEHANNGNQLHLVNITDFDNQVLDEVLRYIYTGKVMNLHFLGKNLLAAAVKYDLPELKLMCEGSFINGMNANNVCEILATADVNNASKLKLKAIDFITSHSKEVIDAEGYATMHTSYPHLLAEAFNTMAVNNNTAPTNTSNKRKYAEYENYDQDYYNDDYLDDDSYIDDYDDDSTNLLTTDDDYSTDDNT